MQHSGRELSGQTLHRGTAQARLLRLDAPVSFWGGVDVTGRVVDVHHPQLGELLAGRVVAVQSGRGSSSSTAVLAEQIRSGSAPAAILLTECDSILVIAALVADELYGVSMPIVQLEPADLATLEAGTVTVRAPDDRAGEFGNALVRVEVA